MLDVAVFQLGVDVDIVGVEDLGVVEGLEDGLLEDFGEEGVLVGRLVAADEGLETLLLAQHPVEQAGVGLANVDAAGQVDGLVQRELDALNQVEGDCVLETTVVGCQFDSDARMVGRART